MSALPSNTALPILLALSLSLPLSTALAADPDTPANPLEFAPSATPRPPSDAAESRVPDAAFFAENAKQPGMQLLPSGAQAIRRKAGSGASARGAELVVMNISRHSLTGVAAAEQARHEQRYVTQQLPRELYEALQLMQEGDQWEVYVPAHPAKRHRSGRPAKAGQAAAAFTIELLSAH